MTRAVYTCVQVLDDNTETGNWIGRDGSSVNYGSIDPETDIYHPDGETLFGEDDEPDDEHYEGYTGNAGAPRHAHRCGHSWAGRMGCIDCVSGVVRPQGAELLHMPCS